MLGFASGIVFDSFASLKAPLLYGIGAFACVSILLFFFSSPRRVIWVGVGLFLACALLGGWRNERAKPDAERFHSFVGEKITVEGIVTDVPSKKNGDQRFKLKVAPLKHRGPVSMLVTAKAYPELAYGDAIFVTGTLAVPENFTTDQGTEFDYVSYLYKSNILYQLKNASAVVQSHGNGNWLLAHLMPLKASILRSYHRVLPNREADLLAGLNLGEKSNIEPDFRNDLITTGTIHMIALSGSNVTILANWLRDCFVGVLKLSERTAAWGGGVSILLFVAMTGLQSSAVRAGIMALISIFARTKGRTYDAFRALLFSGFLMVLYDPKYIVYDTSFDLSFLATLGIIFLTPLLDRVFVRAPKTLLWVIPFREALSVTLGAQLGVLPFILYRMGTLSIISLPANIMVLPAVPYAMALGELAGLVGSFSSGLALPFSFATYSLLSYVTGTISFFARVPYAAVTISRFPLWLCLASYVGLAWLVFRRKGDYSEKKLPHMGKAIHKGRIPLRAEIYTGEIPDGIGSSISSRTKVFFAGPPENQVPVPKKKMKAKK